MEKKNSRWIFIVHVGGVWVLGIQDNGQAECNASRRYSQATTVRWLITMPEAVPMQLGNVQYS
jgi:hypothetical protein